MLFPWGLLLHLDRIETQALHIGAKPHIVPKHIFSDFVILMKLSRASMVNAEVENLILGIPKVSAFPFTKHLLRIQKFKWWISKKYSFKHLNFWILNSGMGSKNIWPHCALSRAGLVKLSTGRCTFTCWIRITPSFDPLVDDVARRN